MKGDILFFADRLPPLIGGMEMHARYFIGHFTGHSRFPLAGIVSKNDKGEDVLISEKNNKSIELSKLSDQFDPSVIFFNSGRWIEDLTVIRKIFPKACFFYRTGGNEILKAPLSRSSIPNHSMRQTFWVQQINKAINILITNSSFTETRLKQLGITCPFIRSVGGVNTRLLKQRKLQYSKRPVIFCAARFVPYKNHLLMLSVFRRLIMCGHKLQLRLAGDGPLLLKVKQQVQRDNLGGTVKFLGALDNEDVCKEIAQALIYMQLSSDQVTPVSGGSYIHSEGMGRSILEALTAGTFIVAARSGALNEIVTEDRGVLVDLHDIEQVTCHIEQVLTQLPNDLPFMEDYCWSNIFHQYEIMMNNSNENSINH